MNKLRGFTGGAVFAMAAVLVVPAGSASALGHRVKPANAVNSTLGAGYLSSPPTGTAVAETEFRVPTITCAKSNDVEALWLGLAGYTGAAGTGSNDVYAQVAAYCEAGVIAYKAVVFSQGVSDNMEVAPGDLIDTYYRESSSSSEVSVTDLTTGPQISVVGPPAADLSVLEGQQDVTARIPTFSDSTTGTNAVYFLNSYVNGYLQRFDGYPTQELRQANHHIQIRPSGLSRNHSGFHLTFNKNY